MVSLSFSSAKSSKSNLSSASQTSLNHVPQSPLSSSSSLASSSKLSLDQADEENVTITAGPPLLPQQGRAPRYTQLYIYDPRDALQERMSRNNNLRADTMALLQSILYNLHPYTRIYRQACDVLSRVPNVDRAQLTLTMEAQLDPRRYNLPTVDEIAGIRPNDNARATESRDIVVQLRSGPLRRVFDTSPAYACLHYVLFFPHGTPGWSYHLRLNAPPRRPGESPPKLTQCMYYGYQLHYRPSLQSLLFYGGRLLQQYVVDAWAITDQNRLRFLEDHQDDIRAELYSGLQDLAAGENRDLNTVGRKVVLPSSYVGSPRYMHQCFQDAMTLSRYFRQIDFFITVTCNPDWPEIARELLPGQTAADRPDLVARVFAMYKDAIVKDLYDNGIFGEAVGYVYTIEFQKRGLPHMHLLLYLKDPWKMQSPADVDAIVRAYWPDPDTEPVLFDIVRRCMVHGPCGDANPNAPCMRNGKCTKGFPKPFQPQTTMSRDGYPLYYRPDDGRAYEVKGVLIDNRYIVPHSAYMIKKFRCHINVECLVSFVTAKYITKYTHKGHDRASVSVTTNHEVQAFLDARYVSAAESVWRLFQFEIHKQVPNVVRLQVHLPGQHMVKFNTSDTLEDILARSAGEQTMLTAFFRTNARLDDVGHIARQYTYQEFPQHFKWDQKEKRWARRQQRFALGRMYSISPTAGDAFYLRTLLTVVRGPRSFEDLRTYDGITYPTFRDACLARGLLEDDGEWKTCLEEACAMRTGASVRLLFATLLLHCEPARPEALWEQYRERICDDLPRRLLRLGVVDATIDIACDYGLYLLQQILFESGKTLADFPNMPSPVRDWGVYSDNPYVAEQLTHYDPDTESAEADRLVALLNRDQRSAYDTVLRSVHDRDGHLFFLDGPGGTGKTFVYRTLCHKLRGQSLIVLCVASSGIASLLLPGGRTSHSTFRIPIECLTDSSTCPITKQSLRADMLRMVRLIIWDEAVMQHRYGPEAVDRTLRDIRDDHRPFGGITVVFGGDFQQILPVVVKGSREDEVGACLRRSPLWNDIEVLHLSENMRVQDDADAEEFARWLLDVGHGRAGLPNTHVDPSSSTHAIPLPDSMLCSSEDDLIHSIYADLSPAHPLPPPDYFLHRTILAPRNEEVHALNNRVLCMLPGQERTYLSADSYEQERGVDGELDDPLNLPVEFLRTLNTSGLPLGELRVKVGSPLILLRNLSPARGLCNGSRMIVQRMSPRVLEVRLIGGEHDGETAFIPRITLTPSISHADFAFKLRRRQFPVRLAFAMSINKAQGQTVKYVGLDLRSSVFTHGQLYVALSRATSSRNLRILPSEDDLRSHTTQNVVYPEVLL